MDYAYFVTGLIVGSAAVWLLLKSKSDFAYQKGRSDLEAEVAALNERLQGRELQIAESKILLDKAGAEIAGLRSGLRSETERRSAAEEKNTRIAEFEITVRSRENQLRELYSENTALKEK